MKLSDQSLEIQLEVGRLAMKMKQLDFPCIFSSMENGPVVRTYLFEPSMNALFAKILSKEEELAGAIGAESVLLARQNALLRIEVPRADRQIIKFDSCLHEMFQHPRDNVALPILLGQSPRGEYICTNLADQPHLLVAGQTGSGKSVFISQVIASLALFHTPAELELILVDTKNLDLVLFRELSHVRSVINNVPQLRKVLGELLKEIRNRNDMMSGIARNIREWNVLQGEDSNNRLNYKVVIVDEMADVFETDNSLRSSMDKEERSENPAISALLKQIAQISRASGIHLICATQRPSVKMVTGDSKIGFGDIKANFPARICFKLPTMVDSRVVLDENGAERLLGRGDFLYKLNMQDSLRRAHSAFISMNNIAMILSQHEEIRRMYAPVASEA